MPKKLLVLLPATLVLLAIIFLQPFRFIDYLFYDLNFKFTPDAPADSVVIVAIDETSISELGTMPWPRSILARLLEIVDSASPRAVAPDLLFPRTNATADNDSLAAVMSRMGNLVLPFRIGSISSENQSSAAIPKDIYKSRILMLENSNSLTNFSFFSGSKIELADTLFTRNSRYSGFLNVSTNTTSQKLREAIHIIELGSEYFPSFGIAATAAYYNLKPEQLVLDGAFGLQVGKQHLSLTSYAGSAFINFRHTGNPVKLVSAADILNGKADLSILKNKLVFVGVTDPGASADFFITPVGTQYPGVAVWANIAQDIIQSRWIRYGGGWAEVINWIIMLILFPGFALIFPNRMKVFSTIMSVLIATGSIAASFYLFYAFSYFWSPAPHCFAFLFSLLWLALQKVDPSLSGIASLQLDPSDCSKDMLEPPSENEFQSELPSTTTTDFITRTLSRDLEQTTAATVVESIAVARSSPNSKIREIADGRIVRVLGTGGMADVYLVWNPRLEVYRAVKVLKPDQPNNLLTRFETEIKIISKFDHPNIVLCYGVGEWHDLPYIEMEFVNGSAMDEVLRRCRLLTIEQTLCIGILVCRALHYAHTQSVTIYGKTYKGIIHRDLKPANIMLSRSGRIKLTDFGIARPCSVSLHTGETGNIIGTLPYLAPEQIDGEDVTSLADLYALGTTLYEFITGERAFPQTEVPALIKAKIEGKYKKISPSARISKDIVEIVEKALSTDPHQRFSSALQMQNELEKALLKRSQQRVLSHFEDLTSRVWDQSN